MNLEFRCKEMRMLPNKDFNSVWNRFTERVLPIFMIGICWCGRIARSCAFSIEVCPCRLFLWISIQNLFDSNRILLSTKSSILCHNFCTNYDFDLLSTSKWPPESQFCERWQKLARNGPKTATKEFVSDQSLMQKFFLSTC